jgi:solute:Na+ symporter, SSS family
MVTQVTTGGLAWIDWTIIFVYAASTIGLGWYIGRRQTSTQEYFVGSGNMNSVLIGVSLFATLLSTISYLSVPGEILGKGPVYLTMLLALPIVYVVVAYYLLPTYMQHRVTSAYELLEARLGLGVRLLGTAMFLIMRLVWMSLLVYLAAKAMVVMLGVDAKAIPIIVLVTGFVSVLYTTLGGLRAVVITDLLQTILLFGGALLVVATITIDAGGLGWFPTEWQANWDTQPIFSFDPKTRVTVVGSILSVAIWYICTAGGDQVSVQRFMATRDVRAARRSLATQLIVSTVVQLTLAIVGLALLGFFQAHQDALPADMSIGNNADDLFPRFISFHLPVGVSGLVVAAMFAAAMSSIDSGVNSITAVVMTDLLDRFGLRPRTDFRQVLAARLLALGVGAIIVIGSSYMERIPGNITTVTSKTVNLLTPSLFALFFFALFLPFSTPLGVWIGWLCGIVTAVLVAFSGQIFGVDPVTGYDPISFQWIAFATLVVNLTVGTVVSWFTYQGNLSRMA